MDRIEFEKSAREFNDLVTGFCKSHPQIGIIATIGHDIGNATIAKFPRSLAVDDIRRMIMELVHDFEATQKAERIDLHAQDEAKAFGNEGSA